MVRPTQIVSGTHAIAIALRTAFDGLQAKQSYNEKRQQERYELVSIAGDVYDSVQPVIGSKHSHALLDDAIESSEYGSLMNVFGRDRFYYRAIPLTQTGGIDWESVAKAIHSIDEAAVDTGNAVVFVQRSRGYDALRFGALSIEDVSRVVQIVKAAYPCGGCKVVVDNCYCEFVDDREPTAVGADLVAGSLIKNPGGTITPAGGYIVGKAALVERAGNIMNAPGIGRNVGAVPGDILRLVYQGLWMSPASIGEAVKGSLLIASVMSSLEFEVSPSLNEERHDVITAVKLNDASMLLQFCKSLQEMSPVGSYITPSAGRTPGYVNELVFADGTFIEGATSELSADGPMREPFVAFCQGGSHWTQWANALANVVESMDKSKLSTLFS